MNKARFNSPESAIRFHETIDEPFTRNPAEPFWYNFIDRDFDTYRDGVSAIDDSMGLKVPSGKQRTQYIRLWPDAPFYAMDFKFKAYYNNGGVMEWYNNEAGFFLELGMDYQNNVGTPLTQFLEITVTAQSNKGQIMYGGANLTPNTWGGDGANNPLPIAAVQGYDYGGGSLFTEYLLPRNGGLKFEVTNTHPTKDLTVTGTVFGYKVRV